MILEDRTVELGGGERHQLRAVGFSLIVHAIFMTILAYLLWGRPERDEAQQPPSEPPTVVARVVIPTQQELRELLAAPKRPPVPPTVPPTPPPPQAKDKISIGPRSDRQAKEIWLKRDEPIANTAQGNGAEGPGPQPMPATPAPTKPPPPVKTADGGLTEPPRSILDSLRQFDKKLERGGSGLGLGKIGPKHADIAYDPQGADFSEWIDHLRRELYRNWIVPQAALMGFRGRVTVHFVVGRDGALLRGDIAQPSGTISLDRAAKNAVLGSRMRPLPPDYGPSEFELSVTFYYNEGPRPS